MIHKSYKIVFFFHLLALDALQGELLLVAGQAVVVGVLLDEAPGADGLLAAVAGEAVLVPTVALVLHLFRAWWRDKRREERELSPHANECHAPARF